MIHHDKPKCGIIVDIGFLLDSSDSLRNDYDKEKKFLKEVVAYFGLSKEGSHASVITFSHSPKHSIKLNDYFDLKLFNGAVDAIPLMGYTTRIDRALRLTQLDMFTEENGGKTGRHKILILLTDGTQTKDAGAEHPGDVAGELRNAGINILSVGIGDGIDGKELAHIAGGAEKTFIAASFHDLLETGLVTRMGKSICPYGRRFILLTYYYILVIVYQYLVLILLKINSRMLCSIYNDLIGIYNYLMGIVHT